MPIGAGTFHPGPKFFAPRSYYRGIVFNISGYAIVDHGGFWVWTKISNPAETWTVIPDVRFYNWSSNKISMDFMIVDFYYFILPSIVPVPQPYDLRLHVRPSQPSQYIEFRWNGVDFGSYQYFDLPPAPPDYWLPRPI